MFEKFDIIDCLKKDEFSSVYLAQHIYLGKKIILKTLNTNNLPDKTVLQRFQREAKILAKLAHPNIIKVLDFGTQESDFYISFEYFESRNLRNFMQEEKIAESQKYQLVKQLLNGLDFAHQNRIVHRDIKPENILVNDQHQLKIADFGLALVINEEQITHKSSIVGTPSYMSPEQIRGEKLTPQSDIFSTGILLYELFSGQHPFLGNDVSATINNILQTNTTLAFENVAIPAAIQPAIRRMIEKDCKRRFKSVSEILDSLRGAADTSPQSSSKKRTFDSTTRFGWPTRFLTITILLVLVVGIGAFMLRKSSPAQNVMLLQEKTPIQTMPQVSDTIQSNTENTILPQSESPQSPQPDESTLQLKTAKKLPEMENMVSVSPDTEFAKLEEKPAVAALPGKLFVQCLPWAEIYIDGKKLDTTPLETAINLPSGDYDLQLRHPNYPVYDLSINLKPGKQLTVTADLDTMFGLFDCNVYPWGEVLVDGKSIGQTPLRQPLLLVPGQHHITISSPQFSTFEDSITIKRNETLKYKLNLEDGKTQVLYQ